MSTNVNYNGVELHNVVTREWDEEVVYDDSHTDVLFTRYKLRFEGIVHAGDPQLGRLSEYAPAWVAARRRDTLGTATDYYQDIAYRLQQARRPLEVSFRDADGTVQPVLVCNPTRDVLLNRGALLTDVDRDLDNGPKPTVFSITAVVGSGCFRVMWGVECAKLNCRGQTAYGSDTVQGASAGGSGPKVVLSNRWSVQESMDVNNYTTRTIQGTLRLSAPEVIANLGGQPVNARLVVTPGLERGFRRDSVEYTTDKTGLKVDYRVTDRQVHYAAPWPATNMTATHTESTNDGISLFSEVNVRLEGPPDADKRLLITRAVQIVDAKLKILEKLDVAAWQFEHAAVIDHMGVENAVECNVRIRRVPPSKDSEDDPYRLYLADLRANTLGAPLALPALTAGDSEDDNAGIPYDPGLSRTPALYGYNHGGERSAAVAFLLQCYLQYPCIDHHAIAKGGVAAGVDTSPRERSASYDAGTQVKEVSPGELKNQDSENLPQSEAAKKAVFSVSRFTNIYFIPQNRVQLPIADSGNPSSVTMALAPATARRLVLVDAERIGDWPELPKPSDEYKDGDLSAVLLDHRVEPQPPTLTPSWNEAKKVYRVSARYLYALSRMPTQTEKLRIGVHPTMAGKATEEKDKFDPAKSYTDRVGP